MGRITSYSCCYSVPLLVIVGSPGRINGKISIGMPGTRGIELTLPICIGAMSVKKPLPYPITCPYTTGWQTKKQPAHALHVVTHGVTVCMMFCMKQFGTTQTLRQHLQYKNSKCPPHLHQVMFPITSHEIEAVGTVTVQSQQSHHRVPVIQSKALACL